jgi:predicted transcriptional regulator
MSDDSTNSHYQQSLQRMSDLYPRLSPALQELLEHAATTGATAKYLAHKMHKSPSTINNQIQSICQKAVDVGYEKDTPWKRIVIDAGIYYYVRNASRSA